MKAAEFRLGNIATGYNDKPYIIDLQFFVNLDNGIDLDEMIKEPMPITEEWLLKFGFELNDYFVSEDHLWKDWVKKGVRIQLPYFDWADADGEISITIKYVHQLQNLYFSLTEEELIYTP